MLSKTYFVERLGGWGFNSKCSLLLYLFCRVGPYGYEGLNSLSYSPKTEGKCVREKDVTVPSRVTTT